MRFIYTAIAFALASVAIASDPAYIQKINDASKNIDTILTETTAYNAADSIRKCHKEFQSGLNAWKSDAVKKDTTVDTSKIEELYKKYISALQDIVKEDFYYMVYSANSSTADDKRQNAKFVYDPVKEAGLLIEATAIMKSYTDSVGDMQNAIKGTQDYKARIDFNNANKNSQPAKQNLNEFSYRGYDKSASQIGSFSQSLLRSDAMAVAISAFTVLLATVTVAGAFFM